MPFVKATRTFLFKNANLTSERTCGFETDTEFFGSLLAGAGWSNGRSKWLKLVPIDCARVYVCGKDCPASVHWHRNPATYKMQSNVSKALDSIAVFWTGCINRARLKNARNQNIKKLFSKTEKCFLSSRSLLPCSVHPSIHRFPNPNQS